MISRHRCVLGWHVCLLCVSFKKVCKMKHSERTCRRLFHVRHRASTNLTASLVDQPERVLALSPTLVWTYHKKDYIWKHLYCFWKSQSMNLNKTLLWSFWDLFSRHSVFLFTCSMIMDPPFIHLPAHLLTWEQVCLCNNKHGINMCSSVLLNLFCLLNFLFSVHKLIWLCTSCCRQSPAYPHSSVC